MAGVAGARAATGTGVDSTGFDWRGFQQAMDILVQGTKEADESPEVLALKAAGHHREAASIANALAARKLAEQMNIASKPENRCVHCGIDSLKRLACTVCKVAKYCSRECQKKDWPHHKKVSPMCIQKKEQKAAGAASSSAAAAPTAAPAASAKAAGAGKGQLE